MDTDSQSPFVVGELKICLNGALPTVERGRQKECPWWECFQRRDHGGKARPWSFVQTCCWRCLPTTRGLHLGGSNSGPPLHPSLSSFLLQTFSEHLLSARHWGHQHSSLKELQVGVADRHLFGACRFPTWWAECRGERKMPGAEVAPRRGRQPRRRWHVQSLQVQLRPEWGVEGQEAGQKTWYDILQNRTWASLWRQWHLQ